MKPIIIILTILFAATCNNNDNIPTPQSSQADIVGTWYLKKYEPGFSPIDYYTNEIKWTFNADSIDVSIVNGTSINTSLPLNSNESYVYSVNGNSITIENKMYNYLINSNELFIEDLVGQSADGKKLTFNRCSTE